MSNYLPGITRDFLAGKVSVQSLSTAAQAETVDRRTADKILMLLSGWVGGAGSSIELRDRVRELL
jgi:hypothetical protein